MNIKPVPKIYASQEVKHIYTRLEESFELKSPPLFFTYIGAFPEYLEYISNQIILVASHSQFRKMTTDLSINIAELIHTMRYLAPMTEWQNLNKDYLDVLQHDLTLQKTFIINIRLAIIFIGIREAVKGWAVAGKQLPKVHGNETKYEDVTISRDMFIFGHNEETPFVEKGISVVSHDINPNRTGLSRNVTGEYYHLCKQDFAKHMHSERFLMIRLQLEKMLLMMLPVLPSTIVSPINVVFDLVEKYPNFSELLYVLTDQFPTLAVQRMMFSGYMLFHK
ncbi:MAG: hypothetical protein WCO06_04590 [Candidatus Roizmanbacteria bacterium]